MNELILSPFRLKFRKDDGHLEAERLTWSHFRNDIRGVASWARRNGLSVHRLLSEINRLPASTVGKVMLRADTADLLELAELASGIGDSQHIHIMPVRNLAGIEVDLVTIVLDTGTVHFLRGGAVDLLGAPLLTSKRSAPLPVFRSPFSYWQSRQRGIVPLNRNAGELVQLACRLGRFLVAEDDEHKRELEELLGFDADLRHHVLVERRQERARRSR
jgi:hypothetical protein